MWSLLLFLLRIFGRWWDIFLLFPKHSLCLWFSAVYDVCRWIFWVYLSWCLLSYLDVINDFHKIWKFFTIIYSNTFLLPPPALTLFLLGIPWYIFCHSYWFPATLRSFTLFSSFLSSLCSFYSFLFFRLDIITMVLSSTLLNLFSAISDLLLSPSSKLFISYFTSTTEFLFGSFQKLFLCLY